MRSKCVRIFPRIVTGWRQLLSNWAWHSGALQPPFRGATTRGRVLQGKHRPRGVKGSSCRVSRQKSRPSYRHADLRAAKVKKKEKKNWERSGLFTVLFLFFVLRKEKEKTHSFFFFLFTATNSPIILCPPYQWRKENRSHSCLAEDKISVLLCLTITRCSAQGPIFLLLQIFLERHEPQEIFTGVMRQMVNLS